MKLKSAKTLLLRFSSFLLCLALLFALPLNASAASDGTEDIIASDMQLSVYEQSISPPSEIVDISDNCSTGIWTRDSFSQFNGFFYVTAKNSNINEGKLQFILLSEDLKLTADHEYNLSFSYGASNLYNSLTFFIQLVYYNSSGEIIKETDLYASPVETKDVVDVDFSFKLDSSDLTGGYKVKLKFGFMRVYNTVELGYTHYFISEEIGFVDKDDDSGWFQKIINAIKEIPDKVVNLGDRISNFFSDLKNGIGSFFTEQWNNIKGAFDNVGTWFIELGDKFNQAINAVGEFIIDGIREILQWAFVPSEEFMDEYIQVIRDKYEEHFGIFAQVTLFLTDTLEYIDSLMDYDYEFVFPEVSLPIAGKTYVIIEKQTVNMKQWLGSGGFGAELYSIYQTCVWAIIIFCIFKYALVVEDVIISGTSSLATKEVVRGYL